MRKGYSIFQRGGKGPWYVAWPDGSGKRRCIKGSNHRTLANEIGRKLAQEADRVRAGVVTTAELKAAESASGNIHPHIRAWRDKLDAKGDTDQHFNQQHNRVVRIFKLAGITRLADLAAEPIQQALSEIKTAQTARHYLTALRGFIKFCQQTNRLLINPIMAVEMPQVAGETFKRTPLSDEQLMALYEATKTRKTLSSLPNHDRAIYYVTMAYTGLRKSEALSLVPESFHIDDQRPHAIVAAAYSKHRREDIIDLRADLVALLRPWLRFKKAGQRVFKPAKHWNPNRIFKHDCKAAGIEPAAGERLGPHSLRRWHITHAIRSGGLAVAQQLARHSTPALTKKYADLNVNDLQRGLAGMPAIGAKKLQKKNRGQVG